MIFNLFLTINILLSFTRIKNDGNDAQVTSDYDKYMNDNNFNVDKIFCVLKGGENKFSVVTKDKSINVDEEKTKNICCSCQKFSSDNNDDEEVKTYCQNVEYIVTEKFVKKGNDLVTQTKGLLGATYCDGQALKKENLIDIYKSFQKCVNGKQQMQLMNPFDYFSIEFENNELKVIGEKSKEESVINKEIISDIPRGSELIGSFIKEFCASSDTTGYEAMKLYNETKEEKSTDEECKHHSIEKGKFNKLLFQIGMDYNKDGFNLDNAFKDCKKSIDDYAKFEKKLISIITGDDNLQYSLESVKSDNSASQELLQFKVIDKRDENDFEFTFDTYIKKDMKTPMNSICYKKKQDSDVNIQSSFEFKSIEITDAQSNSADSQGTKTATQTSQNQCLIDIIIKYKKSKDDETILNMTCDNLKSDFCEMKIIENDEDGSGVNKLAIIISIVVIIIIALCVVGFVFWWKNYRN